MKWRKLGRVFDLSHGDGWMTSHAYLPTAIQLNPARIRVYLAFRDAASVGRLGWIDVSAENPTKLLGVSATPALDVGRPGTFDDNGVSPLSVMIDGDRIRLYYAGWQLTPRARYLLLTGVAFSADGGDHFDRLRETPVLERSPNELIIRSGGHVMREGDVWKIWYAAGSDVTGPEGHCVPTYHLAYSESPDGITWPAQGALAIAPRGPDEFGFGRPCVLFENGEYHMWYSIRTHSKLYRIGYGRSGDGKTWTRHDDQVGIDIAPDGWDSKMIGFASIVTNEHGRFMFYNGNGYGETGVGVARLEGWPC